MKIIITDCSAASAMWIKDAVVNCPINKVAIQRSSAVGKSSYLSFLVALLTITAKEAYEKSLWFDPCEDSWERYVISVAKKLGLSIERVREEIKSLLYPDTYELKLYSAITDICDKLLPAKEVPHYRDLEFGHKKTTPVFSQVESRRPINSPIQGRCY